jgi:hypothetical protein
MMPKDVKKLVKAAEKRGWVYKETRKHNHLRHPVYGLVSFSKSPSCPFAIEHINADIRRKENA